MLLLIGLDSCGDVSVVGTAESAADAIKWAGTMIHGSGSTESVRVVTDTDALSIPYRDVVLKLEDHLQ